jgi:DNA polymerase-3 subunit chi
VWLTHETERPNGPQALFLIDGAPADTAEMAAVEMTAVLFDGHDPDAVETARAQWRAVTAAGLKAAYWAETAQGWVKKAESG